MDLTYGDWRNNTSKETCTWILNKFMLSTVTTVNVVIVTNLAVFSFEIISVWKLSFIYTDTLSQGPIDANFTCPLGPANFYFYLPKIKVKMHLPQKIRPGIFLPCSDINPFPPANPWSKQWTTIILWSTCTCMYVHHPNKLQECGIFYMPQKT